MKQNILYPFYLENANIKSQSIAVELAKNLGVDLHLMVICKNNDFLYNEFIECSKTQEESMQELFYNLKKRYSNLILGSEKQVGNGHGTRIDISFQSYNDRPLRNKLADNYLWLFDYHEFIANVIPAGFNNELSDHDRKVWVISKNRSGILTQTTPLVEQFTPNVNKFEGTMYWDTLPLDIM